ncbi:pyridoxamine 5-phosphate oxidase [Rhizoctonia solani 123E]|uniref:Pyridoxamine 5-phosphate oxidase n=1 Tax=Rhizoctonia solani 123E TaxID=1423351 RepID=A0A074S591_9AGAM|nr:pyridoxamine 5-phosphate oxidase [Rhizoctonia solani 123E]
MEMLTTVIFTRWIEEQRCFWVATAPLNAKGHVNISPKGVVGTFKIIDNKTFFYQDLTGSGVETASHLRENGRITVLFNAFEGPPRICRLFGIGKVHELGSPRYNELIPPEERLSGSRAVVVVDVHKVGTSCGFSVPLYKPDGERTIMQEWTDELEAVDRKFANEQEEFEAANPLSHLEFMASSSDPKQDTRNSRGMKEYWAQENIRSIDGLPGLQFCRELVGLPPGPVKEDRKEFHVDVKEESFMQKFGIQVKQAVGRVDETGFSSGLICGLIIGLALSSTWIQRLGKHV